MSSEEEGDHVAESSGRPSQENILTRKIRASILL